MYIGVWPEYQLAKFVAEAKPSEANGRGGSKEPEQKATSVDPWPRCHRVDVVDPAELAEQSFRRAWAQARDPRSGEPKLSEARLPPLPPVGKTRSQSRPRVFQPPLPQTPPKATPRRAASLPSTPPKPQGAPTCDAEASPGLPEPTRPHSERAPRLAATPPWRSRAEPGVPETKGALPPWIANLRAGLEATRQLFKAGPGSPDLAECSPTPLRSRSAGKLAPLARASGDPKPPSLRSASLGLPTRPTPGLGSRSLPQVAELGILSPEEPVTKRPPTREPHDEASQPILHSAAKLAFDSDEEALIAWSQTVCLDDIDLDGDLTVPEG